MFCSNKLGEESIKTGHHYRQNNVNSSQEEITLAYVTQSDNAVSDNAVSDNADLQAQIDTVNDRSLYSNPNFVNFGINLLIFNNNTQKIQ